MSKILPLEIIDIIYEYYHPYKEYFYYNVILFIKNRYNYSKVLNELKQYIVYNRRKEIIYFATDAILTSH